MVFLKRKFIALLGSLSLVGAVCAAPDEAMMEKGKALYNGAGSCVACHMEDGKGQPGSFPPLAGSDWLDDSDYDSTVSVSEPEDEPPLPPLPHLPHLNDVKYLLIYLI